MRNPATIIAQPAPQTEPPKSDRLVFLGPGKDGVLLEVAAIEVDDGLLVIHAMKMRARYAQHLPGGPPR